MTACFFRWPTTIVTVGLFSLAVSGCVVPGGGYGYGPSFGLGYYEPSRVEYGGWGAGYDVGPVHGGQVYQYRGSGHATQRAYRPAPASRPVPSIPSRTRPPGGSPSRGHAGPSH